MALRQHTNHSYDALTLLSEQQLRSILADEMDSEDVDYELVKTITDVLAAKTVVKPFAPESSFQQFISEYAETDPLYDDIQECFQNGIDSKCVIQTGMTPVSTRKKTKARQYLKLGFLVAAVVAIFVTVSVVASAMGFNILHAKVEWDQNNLGVSSVDGNTLSTDDPYYRVREALINESIQERVVPSFLPEGYTLQDLVATDTQQGRFIDAFFVSGENLIIISYVVSHSDFNEFYPKDAFEPEIYTVNGIEHFITSNEGKYRAVWGNGNLFCDISGVRSKEELLKMINSIYEER